MSNSAINKAYQQMKAEQEGKGFPNNLSSAVGQTAKRINNGKDNYTNGAGLRDRLSSLHQEIYRGKDAQYCYKTLIKLAIASGVQVGKERSGVLALKGYKLATVVSINDEISSAQFAAIAGVISVLTNNKPNAIQEYMNEHSQKPISNFYMKDIVELDQTIDKCDVPDLDFKAETFLTMAGIYNKDIKAIARK